jgi:hypothetical protein
MPTLQDDPEAWCGARFDRFGSMLSKKSAARAAKIGLVDGSRKTLSDLGFGPTPEGFSLEAHATN